MSKNENDTSSFTIEEELEIIEQYYPCLYDLTNEEVLMYGAYNSVHEFQLGVSLGRYCQIIDHEDNEQLGEDDNAERKRGKCLKPGKKGRSYSRKRGRSLNPRKRK